jgi:hypothetical protein
MSSPTRSSIEPARTSRPAWAWAALALLLAGCGQGSAPLPALLPIYFTCDTRGRLEPCGCFTGQYGGLTRLKTVLDAEAPPLALRVDVGDAIGGREDYDLIQYRYLLAAFAAMKFDALNIGQREARLSAPQLRQLKASSPVPLLSANLLDQATRQPLFDPCRIVRRGGCRIALIGLLDPRGLDDDLGPGLQIEDMESALARQLAQLKAKADLIVLLAFTDEESLARLADQFYEIQVILGGKVSQPAQELTRRNRSLIYYVTNESRALGILELDLQRGPAPRVRGNEIRLLRDQIPQDPGLCQLARDYRDEVRRTRLAVDDPANTAADAIPGVRTAAAYVGSRRCIDCHKTAGQTWTNSPHGRAFATLCQHQADADPKCIACHTTGFGTPSGYRRQFGRDKLIDVGCESCHGPGSLHVQQREGNQTLSFTYRPLDAGDCKKCHYGEFSRPFYWHEFWPAIKHGKEPSQT